MCRPCAVTWCNVGAALPTGELLRCWGGQAKQAVTRMECFNEAITLDGQHSGAWNNLGTCIAPGSYATVGGCEVVSKLDCFVKAVTLDPTNFCAWNNLGGVVGVHGAFVNGQRFSRCECVLRSIAINPQQMEPWVNLATSLPPDDDDGAHPHTYSKRHCLETALGIDPSRSDVWGMLGEHLLVLPPSTAVVAGVVVDRRHCLERALELRANITGADGGGDTSCMDAVVSLWEGLACELSRGGGVATVSGRRLDQLDCLVQIVIANPLASTAWNDIGVLLDTRSERGGVRIGEGWYTERQCYERAVTADATNGSAWNNLGIVVEGGAFVMGDEAFSQERCFEMADRILLDLTATNVD